MSLNFGKFNNKFNIAILCVAVLAILFAFLYSVSSVCAIISTIFCVALFIMLGLKFVFKYKLRVRKSNKMQKFLDETQTSKTETFIEHNDRASYLMYAMMFFLFALLFLITFFKTIGLF